MSFNSLGTRLALQTNWRGIAIGGSRLPRWRAIFPSCKNAVPLTTPAVGSPLSLLYQTSKATFFPKKSEYATFISIPFRAFVFAAERWRFFWNEWPPNPSILTCESWANPTKNGLKELRNWFHENILTPKIKSSALIFALLLMELLKVAVVTCS